MQESRSLATQEVYAGVSIILIKHYRNLMKVYRVLIKTYKIL